MKLLRIISEIRQVKIIDLYTPIKNFIEEEAHKNAHEVAFDVRHPGRNPNILVGEFKIWIDFGMNQHGFCSYYILIETKIPFVDEDGTNTHTVMEVEEDKLKGISSLLFDIQRSFNSPWCQDRLLRSGYKQSKIQ
jgi:hypothetical protein